MRLKTNRRPGGFTLIELLVVIVIILMVLAMAIPVVTAFMKNKGLGNAGSMVKAAATKARARAIATRDVHYMLIFIGDGSDSPVTVTVNPVTDSAAPSRQFTSTRNTIVIVDENARATPNNYADWIQKVDEPMSLPKGANFVRGTASPYPDVMEVQFYSDGSLIMVNQSDNSGTSLRKSEAAYMSNISAGEGHTWSAEYDLVITNQAFSSICIMDFISNTGTIDDLVVPK